MQTPADDDAWLARYQAVTEQLKVKESIAQAGASAEADVGAGGAAQRFESIEVAPDATRLGRSGGEGRKPGSPMRTLEAVEAMKAATSAHDVGQADVGETRNAGELPRGAGKEGEVLPGPRAEREELPQQPPQQQQEERLLESQSKAE
jgi:hypothetical protein